MNLNWTPSYSSSLIHPYIASLYTILLCCAIYSIACCDCCMAVHDMACACYIISISRENNNALQHKTYGQFHHYLPRWRQQHGFYDFAFEKNGTRNKAIRDDNPWHLNWITILKPFLNVKWWSRLSVYPGGFVNLATITVSTWSKLIWVSTLY